jgi:hypothetical protein
MNGYVVGMNRQSWEKNIGSLHQLEVGRWPDFPKVNTEEYWKVIGVEYAYVHGDGVVFQQHSEPIGVEYAYVRGGVVVFQQNNEPVDAWVYNELGWADYGDGYEHKWKWYGAFGAYVP